MDGQATAAQIKEALLASTDPRAAEAVDLYVYRIGRELGSLAAALGGMDALLARFPRAKIDTCVKEKEGGDVVYDIEFKVEGRHCESDIKENGTYVNFEQAIRAGEKNQKEVLKDLRELIEAGSSRR